MAALQQFGERLDDSHDLVMHLPQGLLDDLRFAPTKLAERYLRNELAITLEIISDAGDGKFSVLISPHHSSGHPGGSGEMDDNKFLVLIHNVQVMDSKQGGFLGVRSSIRLAMFDQGADGVLSDELYFSVVLGKHVRRGRLFFQDREFKKLPVFVGFPEGSIGKLPDDVIKARPQVMDDFSGQYAKAGWDRATLMVFERLRDYLHVVVTEDRVFAAIEEGGDFGLKIADVLVGPV